MTAQTDAMEGPRLYAGVWQRLGALFIDCLILVALFFVLTVPFKGTYGPLSRTGSVLGNLAAYAYLILLHARYGASLGKMAFGLKVTRLDFSPISLGCACLRYAVPFVALAIPAMLMADAAPDPAAAMLGVYWRDALDKLWLLASVVVMASNAKNRTIHDFIAGTVVIRKRAAGAGTAGAQP